MGTELGNGFELGLFPINGRVNLNWVYFPLLYLFAHFAYLMEESKVGTFICCSKLIKFMRNFLN